MRFAYERISGASFVDDVPYEVLLPVVGGQYGDTVSRPAHQAHVHEHSHHVLSLCQVLGKCYDVVFKTRIDHRAVCSVWDSSSYLGDKQIVKFKRVRLGWQHCIAIYYIAKEEMYNDECVRVYVHTHHYTVHVLRVKRTERLAHFIAFTY